MEEFLEACIERHVELSGRTDLRAVLTPSIPRTADEVERAMAR